MRLQTSIAVIVVSVIDFCHGFALPLPTGSFSVGSRAYTLPKSTLEDPVAPNGTGSFILLNVYYPTKQKVPPSKYIWGGLSVLYDDYYGLRNGSIRNFTARTAYNAESLPRKEWKGLDLPTLIFSLPFAGPPSQVFHAIISDLVSYGYSVVTMDHPYEQPYLQLPDGTGIPGLPFDYDSDTEEGLELIQRVHEYRLTDADAVLSSLPALSKHLSIPLNLTHFSFFGHSLGRSAALSQILYERNHTTAHKHHSLGALTMDGSLWGPAATNDSFADLRVPSLILSSAHHKGDPQFADVDVLQSSWAKEVNLGGKSNHTDFSNLIKVIRSPPHYKMKAERLEHNTTPSSTTTLDFPSYSSSLACAHQHLLPLRPPIPPIIPPPPILLLPPPIIPPPPVPGPLMPPPVWWCTM